MSRESHQQYLKEAAKKAATRAREKAPEKPLPIEEIRHLRIQTVEPWKRILLFMLGSGIGAAGVAAWTADVAWLGVILLLIGVALVVIAITGRKKEIEAVVEVVDLVDIVAGIANLFDV